MRLLATLPIISPDFIEKSPLPQCVWENLTQTHIVPHEQYLDTVRALVENAIFVSPIATTQGRVIDTRNTDTRLRVKKIIMNGLMLEDPDLHPLLPYIFAVEESARMSYLARNVHNHDGDFAHEPLSMRRISGVLQTKSLEETQAALEKRDHQKNSVASGGELMGGFIDPQWEWLLARVFGIDTARKEAIRLEQTTVREGLLMHYHDSLVTLAKNLKRHPEFPGVGKQELWLIREIFAGRVAQLVAEVLDIFPTTEEEWRAERLARPHPHLQLVKKISR